MLNLSSIPELRRPIVVLGLFLLLVLFVVSACITVESDLLATPTPAPAAASTEPDGSGSANCSRMLSGEACRMARTSTDSARPSRPTSMPACSRVTSL